jgi:hypothetical protein
MCDTPDREPEQPSGAAAMMTREDMQGIAATEAVENWTNVEPPAPTLGSTPMLDADGVAIHEGSVLMHITDGQRGVVVEIGRPGHRSAIPIMAVGDIIIQRSEGVYRGTNCYKEWRHIPHNDQTIKERFLSWRQRPHFDDFSNLSQDESMAVSGIMAILPDNIVDQTFGPWPDDFEKALGILVGHLSNTVLCEPPHNSKPATDSD